MCSFGGRLMNGIRSTYVDNETLVRINDVESGFKSDIGVWLGSDVTSP